MNLLCEYGDMVECDHGPTPRVLTVFGELKHPAEGGITYVGGDEKTFGLPLPRCWLRKAGVDLAAADKYRERYLAKAPGNLKDL